MVGEGELGGVYIEEKEKYISRATRPRGFSFPNAISYWPWYAAVCLCRSLSLSLFFSSFCYIPSIFRFRIWKIKKKENDLISAGGRMWPCRETCDSTESSPGQTYTHTHILFFFFGSSATIYENQEPQGVHRFFLGTFYNSFCKKKTKQKVNGRKYFSKKSLKMTKKKVGDPRLFCFKFR